MKTIPASLLILFLLLSLYPACASLSALAPEITVLPRDSRPNLILILTDDLDLHLGTIETMTVLQEQLVQKGLSFGNFTLPTPCAAIY